MREHQCVSTVRDVVVDPDAAGRLTLGEAEAPPPAGSEALVSVEAVSLNHSEVGGA